MKSEIEETEPSNDSRAEGGRLHLLVRSQPTLMWPDDIARIRKAMNKLGFDASDHDIEDAYHEYSEEEMCCGWVVMAIWDKDESAAKVTMRYLVDPNQ